MKKIVLFTVSLLLVMRVSAQQQLTLPKAISIALENNYGIQIADQQIFIAENNDTWARAGRTPVVDLTGSFANVLTQNNNPASFLQGAFYNGSLGANLGATYTLYAGGRIRIAKEQLTLSTQNAMLSKEADIHTLMRTVYQQYYEVLFQQERLTVLDYTYQLSKDKVEYEEVKKAYGTSNTYNLVQLQNALVADSINIISQQQLITIAKRNLYNTLELSGMPPYSYPERLSVVPEDIDIAQLQSVMDEENYTLKTLEMVASLNALNTKLARAARRPTVSLNAGIGATENAINIFSDNPNTGEPFDFVLGNQINANVGASVSWNLYDGGVRKADIQNAQFQEEIDNITLLEARANIASQLELLVDNYNNQKELLNLSDQQIQLAQQNLTISEERLKGGQLTSLDFRAVQSQYLTAALGKVNAIYNLILTKTEIDFLVGKF